MKYLDLHLKENLIRQTSFLRKRHLQKPMSFVKKGLSSNINKTGGSAIVYNRADKSRHRDTQLENPIKG